MKKYQVSFTYVVTVEVEAIDEDQALDLAPEFNFDVEDALNSGATCSVLSSVEEV